jgi:acetyl coenzyme A synthetase (ADP forming)-like protein
LNMGCVMGSNLDYFFFPESVAVVGASKTPGKVGYELLKNLAEFYKGRIYPVNPTADEILGFKAYPSVRAIPDKIDVAVISVPAEKVPEAAVDAGEAGVKGLIVISGGFKEVGHEGAVREERLVEVVRKYGMRLIGPNCVGVYVPKSGMNTLFLPKTRQGFPPHGHIAFVSQSGAFGSAVLDWAALRGLGISKFVSYGNKADVDDDDLLEYLKRDPDTRVITMYIEGVEDGKSFFKALKETTPVKPVVILKSGRTEAGARAASSHTGALAGQDKVYAAAFKQAGVLRAYGMEELFDMALALALQPPSHGPRIAVLTVGGGSGVMATDALADLGLQVPRLSDETVEKLRRVLLPIASPYNPVDVTGSARDEHLIQAADILMRSGEVDAILWLPYYIVPGVTDKLNQEFVKLVNEINNTLQYPIPIVGVATGGSYTAKYSAEAESMGIPMYLSPERAAKAVKALVDYGAWLKTVGTFDEYIENLRKKHTTNTNPT